jgi:hypothetical protein
MTATVSIITGEAKGVLKIPNASMRFTPTLPQEELNKLLEDAGIGQRGQGQPGQKSEGGRGQAGQAGQRTPGGDSQGGTRSGGFQMGQGQELSAEQRARFEQMRASRARQGGMVWTVDDAGKLKPYMVRTGITDNTYSEVTRSELKEGLKIIIGLETPTSTATSQQFGPGGPQQMMRMMGGPR